MVNEISQSQDGIHGSTQLMAHGGQERVLHPVQLAHPVADAARVPGVAAQLQLHRRVPGETAQGAPLPDAQPARLVICAAVSRL